MGSPKQWVDRRRALVNDLKVKAGCTDCGYRLHPAALQFDHRDRAEKIFEISSSLQRAWPKVLAEIAKCDVVCANCHAIRTDRGGYAGGGRPRTQEGCSADACDRPHYSLGMCKRHYDRDYSRLRREERVDMEP